MKTPTPDPAGTEKVIDAMFPPEDPTWKFISDHPDCKAAKDHRRIESLKMWILYLFVIVPGCWLLYLCAKDLIHWSGWQ